MMMMMMMGDDDDGDVDDVDDEATAAYVFYEELFLGKKHYALKKNYRNILRTSLKILHYHNSKVKGKPLTSSQSLYFK